MRVALLFCSLSLRLLERKQEERHAATAVPNYQHDPAGRLVLFPGGYVRCALLLYTTRYLINYFPVLNSTVNTLLAVDPCTFLMIAESSSSAISVRPILLRGGCAPPPPLPLPPPHHHYHYYHRHLHYDNNERQLVARSR